ncbi:hypothetical protein ACT3CE_00210 [Marinifilum sp. RC60d5]|uniref:hypothetical protein n=1 Tax=Marinifilum sp. RC60d5 TaxID=3458414 RepID=UPI004036CE7C
MINTVYLSNLLNHSKSELEKNYNINDFEFDDFEFINFFLINKALNEDNYNLAINFPQRDDKRDFYIPVLLSVTSTLFFQNYVDDKTDYVIGEIVQKDGLRFRIIGKTDDGFKIISEDVAKTVKYPTNKSIKKYIVTTAALTARQVKTKFNHYRNLFKLIFGDDYVPSKFTYKAAIIVERKDFLESLKNKKLSEVDLKKAIPFKWVTKKGFDKNESDSIPIEPMIYLLPDYETFKEFVFDKIENLESVVFIGKNKYEPFLTQIKRDLRKGNIPKAIFIGSNGIDNIENLKTWKWTQSETNYFNEIEDSSFNLINTAPSDFINSIQVFEQKIQEIDTEYCFNLKTLFRLKKILYSTVLPNKNFRLVSQLEYLRHIYSKEIYSIVSESFFEINEDPKPHIDILTELANSIIANIPLDKWDSFLKLERADILIVPERFKDTWLYELKSLVKIKVLSFKEFKNLHNRFTTRKNIAFLTIFGFADSPNEILRFIEQTSNDFYFILYPEEIKLVEKLLNKCKNESIEQFGSKHRYSLSHVEYPIIKEDEDISDIISKFYEQDSFENRTYHYEHTENIEYKLTFKNDEIVVLEGSKAVLLLTDNQKRKEKVSNIVSGDKVRVYENTSKERLFEIASENDEQGKLVEIIENSKTWKQCLINYYNNKKSYTYNEEQLLKELLDNGAKIQIVTLKKWLNISDKDFFPSQIINLIAIKRTIDCDILNSKFDEIKRCKKAYRSIMIALGRDLSDEIMDYIISNKKVVGKILQRFNSEQIDKFINESAPLQTVKNIQILENCEHE